jgi:spore germination cell wall hydrolase CwlJ-like protein
MRFSTRAGGVAAALLLCALVAVSPTPSRARPVSDPSLPLVPALAVDLPPAAPAPMPVETVPAAPVPAPSLAARIADDADPAPSDAEEACLASAVYFESKGEPLRGQLAVAQVIVNRTRSGRFPASLCGVVKQRGQFSFVHSGHLPSVPRASAGWRKALAVARIARGDGAGPAAGNALFFHARRVSPGWHAVRVATIGNQVFYR